MGAYDRLEFLGGGDIRNLAFEKHSCTQTLLYNIPFIATALLLSDDRYKALDTAIADHDVAELFSNYVQLHTDNDVCKFLDRIMNDKAFADFFRDEVAISELCATFEAGCETSIDNLLASTSMQITRLLAAQDTNTVPLSV